MPTKGEPRKGYSVSLKLEKWIVGPDGNATHHYMGQTYIGSFGEGLTRDREAEDKFRALCRSAEVLHD